MSNPPKIQSRQFQITEDYLKALDLHLEEILQGRTTEMLEIRGIADVLNIHPTHLSNTVKLTTGNSACYYYEHKILAIAKSLLEQNQLSVSAIASRLTYDPSNFTKFFKHYTGQTPKQYREQFLTNQRIENSVSLTKNSVTLTKGD